MNANLSLYHIFYTVARCGNISRAAAELYISQPAISKAIKTLEASLKVPLFHRSSRGVRLTEEGELLFSHVESAFSALSLGEERLQDFHNQHRGHLRIGASTTLSKYVLLPGLKKFMADFPNIRISLSCQSSTQTERLLKEGKLDVAILGTTSCKDPSPYYPLGSVEDIFVASPSYLEMLGVSHRSFPSDKLPYAALMLLEKSNLSRQYIEPYLSASLMSVPTENILEVGTMDLLIEFAKIGLGIACVIQEFVREDLENGHLVKIPLTTPIPRRNLVMALHTLPTAIEKERLLSYFMIRP